MGHWKTLHLFDDKKFYDKIVPSLREKGTKWRAYYYSGDGAYQLEDRDVFSEERLDIIQSIANDLKDEFRIYPKFKKLKGAITRAKMEEEVEDFNMLLALVVFSECALFNPYFVLGRGVIAKQKYYGEQTTLIDKMVTEIEFGLANKGNIIGLGTDTILHWMKYEDVRKMCKNYKAITSSLKGAKVSENSISHLFSFLNLAVKHGLGVISCMDIDGHVLKNKKPIGKNINFKKIKIDRLVFEKEY